MSRYEAVRARLPSSKFPTEPVFAPNLLALSHKFDAFILDGFGVLNVGTAPIPGAPDTVAALKRSGKTLVVLTNGAVRDAHAAHKQFVELGFAFAPWQICSSRDVLAHTLLEFPSEMNWGIAAPDDANILSLGVPCFHLDDRADTYGAADGFVYLGQRGWSSHRQNLLLDAVRTRPRPIFCGNPDLIAPLVSGFSIEPGAFAHALMDDAEANVTFFGKPFANAFDEALRRVAQNQEKPLDTNRVAMVGDTLHTDILGGAAAGLRTVLVTGHGLLRNHDPTICIRASGIVPDYVVHTP